MTFREIVGWASIADYLVFFVLLIGMLGRNRRPADPVLYGVYYVFGSLALMALIPLVRLVYEFSPTAWWPSLLVINFMVANKVLLWSMVRARKAHSESGEYDQIG